MSAKNQIEVWNHNRITQRLNISPLGIYDGITVIAMVNKAQLEIGEFNLSFNKVYGSAQLDIQNLLNKISSWCDRISDVALVTGSGEKLCAWLKANNVHGVLIGTLHELKVTLETYREKGLDLVPANDLGLAQMTTEVEQLASACLKAQKGEDNGKAILDWMAERKVIWQKITTAFKDQINLGGRNPGMTSERVYLRDLALKLKRQYKLGWWQTGSRMIQDLKAQSEHTEDERKSIEILMKYCRSTNEGDVYVVDKKGMGIYLSNLIGKKVSP